MLDQVIDKEHAKKFRAYGLVHPEMSELNTLKFVDPSRIKKKMPKVEFIGVNANGNDIFDKIQALSIDGSIVIDANYQNIFEDYIKCDFDKDTQEYIKQLVDGKSVEEIVYIIEEIFIKPLMTNEYHFDSKKVYFKIPGPGSDLTIYDKIITLE